MLPLHDISDASATSPINCPTGGKKMRDLNTQEMDQVYGAGGHGRRGGGCSSKGSHSRKSKSKKSKSKRSCKSKSRRSGRCW
jgi:hypothetical protein